MPFEKQIHRLFYIISQKQTNLKKKTTWKKIKSSRNLWAAACQSVEDQWAHVFSVRSESHRFELFRLSCSLLVWFLVRVIDFGFHAVHALCPLSIDHSPLLLTKLPGKEKGFIFWCCWFYLFIYFLKRWHNKKRCYRWAPTSCPGCDLPPCAALFQTCRKVWSSTHTYRQCWWRTSQNKHQNSMLQTLWNPYK